MKRLLPLLLLAACVPLDGSSPPEANYARPGHEECMKQSGQQMAQDVKPLTGDNSFGQSVAVAAGAVFTAPACLLFNP